MKILVLGGGAQGSVIASDLAETLTHARVTVADIRRPPLPALPNLEWIEADGSDSAALAPLMNGYDLVVGALPSWLGFGAMRAAIEARRPIVDVSFSAESPLALDADARRAGVAVVPDCGLAPGLSHLLVGRAIAEHGTPDEVVSEKTLRWPGHVEAIRPLLAQGRLVETFRARCTVDPPEDLVVLAVRGRWGSHTRETLLVDRYDPRSGRSAMSRTTALTTSACAQAMATGLACEPGVQPLERVAKDARAFAFVRGALAQRGVRIGEPAPMPG